MYTYYSILCTMASLCLFVIPTKGFSSNQKLKKSKKHKICRAGYTKCALTCNRGSVLHAKLCSNIQEIKKQLLCQKQSRAFERRCILSCYKTHCNVGKKSKSKLQPKPTSKPTQSKKKQAFHHQDAQGYILSSTAYQASR